MGIDTCAHVLFHFKTIKHKKVYTKINSHSHSGLVKGIATFLPKMFL